MCSHLVLAQSLRSGVGFFAVNLFAFEFLFGGLCSVSLFHVTAQLPLLKKSFFAVFFSALKSFFFIWVLGSAMSVQPLLCSICLFAVWIITLELLFRLVAWHRWSWAWNNLQRVWEWTNCSTCFMQVKATYISTIKHVANCCEKFTWLSLVYNTLNNLLFTLITDCFKLKTKDDKQAT